jgi:putative transposase
MTATDITRIPEELFRKHGQPICIRSDNGSELVSKHVQNRLENKHVDTHYIEPGSPWQNAYCESLNSNFRTTCPDRCLFSSMTEARVIVYSWLDEYNTVRSHRSHRSLGGLTPETFLQRWSEQDIY